MYRRGLNKCLLTYLLTYPKKSPGTSKIAQNWALFVVCPWLIISVGSNRHLCHTSSWSWFSPFPCVPLRWGGAGLCGWSGSCSEVLGKGLGWRHRALGHNRAALFSATQSIHCEFRCNSYRERMMTKGPKSNQCCGSGSEKNRMYLPDSVPVLTT